MLIYFQYSVYRNVPEKINNHIHTYIPKIGRGGPEIKQYNRFFSEMNLVV